MSATELSLKGAKADYIVQYAPASGSSVPVLVGVGQFTRNEVHLLQGIQIVAFADGRLDLTLTPLAQPHAAGATVSSSAASIQGYDLQSWVMDDASDPREQTVASVGAKPIRGFSAPKPESVTASVGPEDPDSEMSQAAPESMRSAEASQIPATPMPDASSTRSGAEEGGTPAKSLPGAIAQADSSNAAVGFMNLSLPTVLHDPPLTEWVGTAGPDLLKGGSGRDLIDGLVNSETDAGRFFEQLLGMAGDDQLIYRGFVGETDGLPSISAQLDGDDGNDVLDVTLDGISAVEVSGGAGTDVLVIQTGFGHNSPWDSEWMTWQWSFDQGSYLLNGTYTQAMHDGAGVTEIRPDLEWISSGASFSMRLIRPDAGGLSSMEGSAGRDWLLAADATRHIDAKAGDDVVLAKEDVAVSLGAGVNTVYADSARYTLSYSDTPYGVRVNLANNMGLVFDEDAALYAIDRLLTAPLEVHGSAHKDVISGDAASNTLRTGGGSDVLTGDAGADWFILDSNPLVDKVRLTDLDVFAGDHLTLNLSAWQGRVDASFSSVEVVDAHGEHLWRSDIASSPEAGSLLSVMLSADHKTLYWVEDVDTSHALLVLDTPLPGLSADQWAAVLSVDYL